MVELAAIGFVLISCAVGALFGRQFRLRRDDNLIQLLGNKNERLQLFIDLQDERIKELCEEVAVKPREADWETIYDEHKVKWDNVPSSGEDPSSNINPWYPSGAAGVNPNNTLYWGSTTASPGIVLYGNTATGGSTNLIQ